MKLNYQSPLTQSYEIKAFACFAASDYPRRATAEDMDVSEEQDW